MSSKFWTPLVLVGILIHSPLLLQAQSENSFSPGLEVGAKIPSFEAVDQDGERRTFEDLKGPQGLLLLFHRSADW